MNLEHLLQLTQVSVGFLLFWVLSGWSLLVEMLSPSPAAPQQKEPWSVQGSQAAHVVGQGLTLVAVSLLSLVCSRLLLPTLRASAIELTWVSIPWSAVVLSLLALLLGIESVAIFLGRPLALAPSRMEADLSSGRDQFLRHAPALFLGLVLMVLAMGLSSFSRLGLGLSLGWGACVFLRDRRAPVSLVLSLRAPVAGFGLALAVLFLVRMVRAL